MPLQSHRETQKTHSHISSHCTPRLVWGEVEERSGQKLPTSSGGKKTPINSNDNINSPLDKNSAKCRCRTSLCGQYSVAGRSPDLSRHLGAYLGHFWGQQRTQSCLDIIQTWDTVCTFIVLLTYQRSSSHLTLDTLSQPFNACDRKIFNVTFSLVTDEW